MKHAEAEKLLGGYATGTLTEVERQALFAAALDHQEIFDALADEEALRELLSDPQVKAQLLAALASAAPPKVVPLWRRPGLMGAAAGLIVAATASLAYLRSPEKAPPPLAQEAVPPSKAKAAEPPAPTPPGVQSSELSTSKRAPAEPLKEAAPRHPAVLPIPPPPPPPSPMQHMTAAPVAGASASAVEDAHREKAKADFRRTEVQANLAKKVEPPRIAAAAQEVVAAPKAEARERRADTHDRQLGGVPGGVIGGVVGGVASRAPGSDQAGKVREDAEPPPASARSQRRVEGKAGAELRPSWTLERQPNGTTRVLVNGPAGAQAVLLRRGAAGVEALALRRIEPGGDMAQWRVETRLRDGDVLDLYLLNAPVAEPTLLPETGPVAGYRVRIHPATK